MIRPRNTAVVLKLIEKKEQKVGAIVITDRSDCFAEAEVIAVGPGMVQAGGGRSETFDLKRGQRVLVKHKTRHQRPGTDLVQFTIDGLPYREGDENYVIFEQTGILAILAEPVEQEHVALQGGEGVGLH